MRISGLTHGRNIIFKSRGKLTAQFKAYKEKKISFQQLIASRDQIVTELIKKNIGEKIAIETADSVKSGFGIPKKYEKEIIQKTEK